MRRLTLEVDAPAEVAPVLTDREALRRVVCSLIENAVKYTPEGGRITVKASASHDPGGVEITVKDTGCGILGEDVPFVFEKFFRGRPAPSGASMTDAPDGGLGCGDAPGVGLGLYLAHRIVGQLGGSISVESPPQGESRGTAFTVRLPVWHDDGGDAGEKSEEKTNVEAVTGS
jgi:signal transduction histidine kinase